MSKKTFTISASEAEIKVLVDYHQSAANQLRSVHHNELAEEHLNKRAEYLDMLGTPEGEK